jgi:hypothetical protein
MFKKNDRVSHIKFGPAIVVGRYKSSWAEIPDETILIKPDVQRENHAAVLMVDECACKLIEKEGVTAND